MCRISKGVMVSSTGCLHAKPTAPFGSVVRRRRGLHFRRRQPPTSVEGCWSISCPFGTRGRPRPFTGNSGDFYTLQAELLLVSPPAVQFGYCRALEAVSVSPEALALIVVNYGWQTSSRRPAFSRDENRLLAGGPSQGVDPAPGPRTVVVRQWPPRGVVGVFPSLHNSPGAVVQSD